MVVRSIASALAALGLVLACGGPASQPPTGPNTSFPCGHWGVSCGNGACCPWAHVCGVATDPWRRCEVGYCCADGDPFYGASRGSSDDGGSVTTPPTPFLQLPPSALPR